jgi:hypothetical protein
MQKHKNLYEDVLEDVLGTFTKVLYKSAKIEAGLLRVGRIKECIKTWQKPCLRQRTWFD